jgi:uncharacterized protein (DUF2147 family)
VRHLPAFLLPLLLTAPLAASEADAILGLWQTEPTDKGYARIEIGRQGELYAGRIVWLSEPDFPPGDEMAGQPKVDRLNPAPELRGRPILGLPLMVGFRYDGDQWKDGRIYDPETGNTYRGKIRLASDGTLRLRGFIGISLLGRTTVWVRPPAE